MQTVLVFGICINIYIMMIVPKKNHKQLVLETKMLDKTCKTSVEHIVICRPLFKSYMCTTVLELMPSFSCFRES